MIIVLIILGLIVLGCLFYYLFMSSYSQVFGNFPWHGSRKQKIIGLTFDDGPNKPYTNQVLDILEKHNIKATFFLVGKCIERDPETAQEVLRRGHVIANHSYSHEFKNYLTSLSFKNEISKNQEVIKKHLGVTPALYRSPWLFRQPFIIRQLKISNLSQISGQFCHSFEVAHVDGRKIADHCLRISKNGTILIFHDGKESVGGDRSQTVKGLELTILGLKAEGYSFETIPKMLNLKAYN
jgi:peptidoglycan-N-acetylglucosamine deacetylase